MYVVLLNAQADNEKKEIKKNTEEKGRRTYNNICIYMLAVFLYKQETNMFTKVKMHIDHLVLLLSILLSLFLLMNNLAI
jgi:hypothetical protein